MHPFVLVRGLLIALLASGFLCGVNAARITVSTLDALQLAIVNATPGDTIVISDGPYRATSGVRIATAGTRAAPITIEAESIGGAEITGSSGFTFEAPAAHIVLRGFNFTHAAGTMRVPTGVNHCRITRNVFQLAIRKGERAPYLVVSGDDTEIDHNTFRDKSTEGQMLSVQGPGSDGMAQRTWIHHNYFEDFRPAANNSSALHIGHSARSMTPAHSIVEYNLFVACRGENEGAICNKSCDNIYRFNTFTSASTELSLRHGNRCQVYGNFFIGTTGLRFFGHDHRIFSNYFENCNPAIAIGNGGATIPPGPLTSHDRPDRVHVVYNTLVNNRRNVQMSPRRRGLGANGLVFGNNIIQGGNEAVLLGGPLADPVWEGNLIWKAAPGHMPDGSFRITDPQLVADTNGIWRPIAASPVQGKGIGLHNYVTVDMDGESRPDRKDIGADQLSKHVPKNRVLTIRDVGPDAPEGERPPSRKP